MGTESERLAAFEAILTRVEAKLDRMADNYPSRVEVAEMLRSRDERFQRLEDDVKSRRQLLPNWVNVAIAVAALLVALSSHLGGH